MAVASGKVVRHRQYVELDHFQRCVTLGDLESQIKFGLLQVILIHNLKQPRRKDLVVERENVRETQYRMNNLHVDLDGRTPDEVFQGCRSQYTLEPFSYIRLSSLYP